MDRYTVEPGRVICRDGKALVYINVSLSVAGSSMASPADADVLTHKIVALLNAADMPSDYAESYERAVGKSKERPSDIPT